MFTVDTSVYVNAIHSAEQGSSDSELFLKRVFQRPWPVFSPTLLLVEMATAIARVFDDTGRGLAMAQAARDLPGQIWVPLEESLADEAARLGAEHRLRGADAIYAAVANRYGATLVTRDHQQLERLGSALPVITPSVALTHLAETDANEEQRSSL
jgi:predicted nucleic acid-binding protein